MLLLTFLGTSGSMPTPERGSSCVVIRKGRELIMFDCGEGTQRQMVSAGIGFQRNMNILISHMHGDHILGIPGLLQSMSLLKREKELNIYGPIGLAQFIKAFTESIGGPTFPVIIHEINESGVIHENTNYKLVAVKAKHREVAWSFGFIESKRPGKFYPYKARKLGIPVGPNWKKLQKGESIVFDGRKIDPDMVTDPPRPGRTIVYSGDTSPNTELKKLARGADILVHEATFLDEMTQRAEQDGHSTAYQAANLAKEAEVDLLILTHISPRYSDPIMVVDEAKQIFDRVLVAEDLMQITVNLK